MGIEQFSQQPIKVIIDTSLTTNEDRISDPQVVVNEHTPTILKKLHAGYFRISISLGAQALLWKTLSENTDDSQAFHRIFRMLPSTAFLLLWWVSLFTLTLLSLLYIMRCIFYFQMVKAEFSDHVGVNYLFSPWISWLLLVSSSPYLIPETLSYHILWWLFVGPMVILDIKVYGQWITTKKRYLSMFANPTSQISVIGNLVGAWAASEMGWKESAMCMFTLGMVHYLVVFITLYQRVSGTHVPARLRPVFFLFVAAPSMGSLAWSSINGGFDTVCKMLFFLSIFLLISLACRPALFKKSMKKFTVAWWAYSFPVTFLTLASSEYAQQVKGVVAMRLTLVLSAFSVLIFLSLLVISTVKTNRLLRNDHSFCLNDSIPTSTKTKDGCKVKSQGAKGVLPL